MVKVVLALPDIVTAVVVDYPCESVQLVIFKLAFLDLVIEYYPAYPMHLVVLVQLANVHITVAKLADSFESLVDVVIVVVHLSVLDYIAEGKRLNLPPGHGNLLV